MHGRLDGVEERLRDAESWLVAAAEAGEAPSAAVTVGVDDTVFRGVRSEIALYRAAQARVTGDVAGTMTHAWRVLDLVREDDHLVRGSAAGLLGLAHWGSGDLEAAHRWWSDSRANLEKAGHHSDLLGVAIALADIRIAQGRLRDALATYEQGLSSATTQGSPAVQRSPVLRGAADMHVGMGELLRERNDLEAARQHLARSAELGEHAGLPQNRHRWRVAMARVREAEGDLGGVVDLLDEAERLYVSDMFPDVRPIAAVRARVWLAQRRVGEALDWASERGLAVEGDLPYLREFEHITLARTLLAQYAASGDEGALSDATRLLERLLHAAQEGQRTGSTIELMVLRALARQARGDVPGALDSLERALTLAEPEGYVRVFVDEGPPMASLLKACAKQGSAPAYVRRLLTALTAAHDDAPVPQRLIEPLSARELELLRLLGTELDGPGIARELVVSLNTVRTHTKNIYAKLGVNNRRSAVRRGTELELLSRRPER
jgi:LuxR family maltose regulon positive regulatory protein